MSIYNKTAVWCRTPTASTAGLSSFITFPNDFLIREMWVVIRTAGAQATHKIQITNAANTVTYAEITTGTNIAGTVLQVNVPETSRFFTGGTPVAVRNVVNDASAVYDVYILLAHAE
jgi:hypothetical protein